MLGAELSGESCGKSCAELVAGRRGDLRRELRGAPGAELCGEGCSELVAGRRKISELCGELCSFRGALSGALGGALRGDGVVSSAPCLSALCSTLKANLTARRLPR
jgi:hypothetical protein